MLDGVTVGENEIFGREIRTGFTEFNKFLPEVLFYFPKLESVQDKFASQKKPGQCFDFGTSRAISLTSKLAR